jgi:hypothetical protein
MGIKRDANAKKGGSVRRLKKKIQPGVGVFESPTIA